MFYERKKIKKIAAMVHRRHLCCLQQRRRRSYSILFLLNIIISFTLVISVRVVFLCVCWYEYVICAFHISFNRYNYNIYHHHHHHRVVTLFSWNYWSWFSDNNLRTHQLRDFFSFLPKVPFILCLFYLLVIFVFVHLQFHIYNHAIRSNLFETSKMSVFFSLSKSYIHWRIYYYGYGRQCKKKQTKMIYVLLVFYQCNKDLLQTT